MMWDEATNKIRKKQSLLDFGETRGQRTISVIVHYTDKKISSSKVKKLHG